MHHLIVCYGHPDEPASFDQYYSTTHRPLADKIPGVRTWHAGKVSALDQSQAPYHLVAVLSFDSRQALDDGLASPEGRPPPPTSETSPPAEPPCSSPTTSSPPPDLRPRTSRTVNAPRSGMRRSVAPPTTRHTQCPLSGGSFPNTERKPCSPPYRAARGQKGGSRGGRGGALRSVEVSVIVPGR